MKWHWLESNIGFILGVFSLGLCILLAGVFLISDFGAKRRVGPEVPERMFVLVVCDGEPSLICGDQLDEFIKKHPDCSFLVPEGQEESLNQKLAAILAPTSEVYWKFKIKQIADGKQAFQVVAGNDDRITVSWYESERHRIVPQYLKEIGVGQAFQSIPLGVGLWVILGLAGRALHRKIRASKIKQL